MINLKEIDRKSNIREVVRESSTENPGLEIEGIKIQKDSERARKPKTKRWRSKMPSKKSNKRSRRKKR